MRSGMAGFRRTRRGCGRFMRGEIQRLGKGERTAIAVPQTPSRMDEQTERRGHDRFRPHRPALEGMEGRSPERIERAGAKVRSQRVDKALRPAIERVGQSVTGLGRRGEGAVAGATDPAEKDERTDLAPRQEMRDAILRARLEGATKDEAERGQAGGERGQIHAHIRPAASLAGQGQRACARSYSGGLGDLRPACTAGLFGCSFQVRWPPTGMPVRGSIPDVIGSIVIQSSIGQTTAQRLQPTHSRR